MINASRWLIVMALAGCASAPSSTVPAPAPAAAATAFRIVRDGSVPRSQACATVPMPNGRTRDTFSAGGRYQSPGKPARMPNACPVRMASPATLVRPVMLPAPTP